MQNWNFSDHKEDWCASKNHSNRYCTERSLTTTKPQSAWAVTLRAGVPLGRQKGGVCLFVHIHFLNFLLGRIELENAALSWFFRVKSLHNVIIIWITRYAHIGRESNLIGLDQLCIPDNSCCFLSRYLKENTLEFREKKNLYSPPPFSLWCLL